MISVSTTGPPDRENWYMIWKYAAAVAYLCVLERRASGAAYGLGEGAEPNLSTEGFTLADCVPLGLKYGKMHIEMGVGADGLS